MKDKSCALVLRDPSGRWEEVSKDSSRRPFTKDGGINEGARRIFLIPKESREAVRQQIEIIEKHNPEAPLGDMLYAAAALLPAGGSIFGFVEGLDLVAWGSLISAVALGVVGLGFPFLKQRDSPAHIAAGVIDSFAEKGMILLLPENLPLGDYLNKERDIDRLVKLLQEYRRFRGSLSSRDDAATLSREEKELHEARLAELREEINETVKGSARRGPEPGDTDAPEGFGGKLLSMFRRGHKKEKHSRESNRRFVDVYL